MLRVLIDGWPLAYIPAGPQSLHLAAQMETFPAGLQAELALPAHRQAAAWLPPDVILHSVPTPNTAWGQLLWSQRSLLRLAASTQAEAIFTTEMGAPLLGQARVLANPAGWGLSRELERRYASKRPGGLAQRLSAALGWGGLSRSQAVHWPHDLPLPMGRFPWRAIPPLVHPLFFVGAALPLTPNPEKTGLPETYILYHGLLNRPSLELLAACWSWAAGALGAYYPLLIYGVDQSSQGAVNSLFQESGLTDSIRLLPPQSPVGLAKLYRGCSVLLHPGPTSPWGCPLRHALASGKPVVACAGRWTEALVGPAAYLVPPGDPRKLAAALISVIVDADLAERLSAAAQAHSTDWKPEHYWQAVLGELAPSASG